jgi:hypothetical protein
MNIEDENKLKIHQIDPPSFTSKNDHTEREYIGVDFGQRTNKNQSC